MEKEKIENLSLQKYINQDAIKARFREILGERANTFISAVISLANNNQQLKKASPESITMAGIMAATLNLPINQNLGFAYVIPYNCKVGDNWVVQAQFQIGYKGIIQLAQRSGQFKTINVSDVKEGEIKEFDRLTGEIIFEWNQDREKLKTIGYVAYFALLNGFSKSMYKTIDELKEHGLKFSKTFSNEKTRKNSLWETDFNSMAFKTMIKLLLGKYAPLSVELERAIIADQSVIKNEETMEIEYVDNDAIELKEVKSGEEKKKELKEKAANKTENTNPALELM